jgi:hypothetical protein
MRVAQLAQVTATPGDFVDARVRAYEDRRHAHSEHERNGEEGEHDRILAQVVDQRQ